jgi:hypothetical protein
MFVRFEYHGMTCNTFSAEFKLAQNLRTHRTYESESARQMGSP